MRSVMDFSDGFSLFAAVRDGRWFWGLGDPNVGAILVTGLYFLVSVSCFMVARRFRARGKVPIPATRFWLMVSFLLFCLGVNKQADFQSLLTLLGRDFVRRIGWYEDRRTLQFLFIVVLVVFSVLSVSLIVRWVSRCRWSWHYGLATVGLGIQAAFVVMRAASFHHVDTLLGMRLGELKLNLVFESIGLSVILLAAVSRWPRSSSNTMS